MTAGVERTGTRGRLAIAAAIVALALASGLLWARFGPAVFADMMASAWRFCF